MANDPEAVDSANEAWRIYLTTGEPPEWLPYPWYRSKHLRRVVRRLPSAPRCRVCHFPFQGTGGTLIRHLFGIEPSRLNPQLCNQCEEFAKEYHGGAEVETSLLFADVRGSTALAEGMNPIEFSRLINRFYDVAMRVLISTNAMIEKLVGDQVTGFYVPGFAGLDHTRIAIDAARLVLEATGHNAESGPWIPVGVGVHTGTAYIGAVHSEAGVSDIAVLGDAANVGARLAAQAQPGEVVLSEAARAAAGLSMVGMEARRLPLKGRTEPVDAWILRMGSAQHALVSTS